jgi:hypothetical protein
MMMTADEGHQRAYVEAVVAAIETAGIGVERYDVAEPSILIDRSSAGVFGGHRAVTLFWDDRLGWRLGVFYANGKGGYHWLLPVPPLATPGEVAAALLTARSGAPLPEVPDDVPPASNAARIDRTG